MEYRRILIVDDEPLIGKLYETLFRHKGYSAASVQTLREMREKVATQRFDCVLLDLNLDEESGMDALPFLLNEAPLTEVVILTSDSSIENAVQCLRLGATHYLTKGRPGPEVVEEVDKLLGLPEQSELQLVNHPVREYLIGESSAIQRIIAMIDKLKNVDSTVLILGESGTGKEVVARAIHQMSTRAGMRFDAINCSAIPENLLESELFGHRKGAFTDARQDRKGLLEICSQGTFLLDEIGDMPLSLQSKLLRVLQEKKISPIGSHEVIPIQTRILAATNRDIYTEVKEGRFREDLFYRLSVVILALPPLRQRREDIPALVEYFQGKFNERFGKSTQRPSPVVMSKLIHYDWPGNIRELQNAIERAVVLSLDGQLRAEDLFQHKNDWAGHEKGMSGNFDGGFLNLPLNEAKREFERQYIIYQMRKAHGNISEVARTSGRYRADIYKLLDRFQLEQDHFRN